MPAYSFKERFVPMIINGTKHQTIRAYRRNLPMAGQMAYLFFGLRTKWCHKLLAPQKQKKVCTIWIFKDGDVYLSTGNNPLPQVTAERYLLTRNRRHLTAGNMARKLEGVEKDLFAWKDGFRMDNSTQINGCFNLLIRFWRQTHDLPFTGTVTYW